MNRLRGKRKIFMKQKTKIITEKNMSFDVSDIVSVIINVHYFDQIVIFKSLYYLHANFDLVLI
jgi:hypothetical protein